MIALAQTCNRRPVATAAVSRLADDTGAADVNANALIRKAQENRIAALASLVENTSTHVIHADREALRQGASWLEVIRPVGQPASRVRPTVELRPVA